MPADGASRCIAGLRTHIKDFGADTDFGIACSDSVAHNRIIHLNGGVAYMKVNRIAIVSGVAVQVA